MSQLSMATLCDAGHFNTKSARTWDKVTDSQRDSEQESPTGSHRALLNSDDATYFISNSLFTLLNFTVPYSFLTVKRAKYTPLAMLEAFHATM